MLTSCITKTKNKKKKPKRAKNQGITRRVDKWWDDGVFDDVIVTLSHTIAHFNEGREDKIKLFFFRGISLHPF